MTCNCIRYDHSSGVNKQKRCEGTGRPGLADHPSLFCRTGTVHGECTEPGTWQYSLTDVISQGVQWNNGVPLNRV